MAQPAAPVAIAIGINRCTNEEPTPVEVPKPMMVMVATMEVPKPVVVAMVTPANRTDQVGRGFAEVGLNGR
jgi:hypothetical protein